MLYFGSRNFGQANFGKGLIKTAIDESQSTGTMAVAGYNFFTTSTLHSKGVVNVDIASGLVQGGYLDIPATTIIRMSGIKMTWKPQMATPKGTGTVSASGFLAWDSQLVDETTWTTQTVD
tara:strand:+ start:916 stop:1275 length:360 start_codon:yes stop_codon:yes gene_type:complete